jgi:hypothetical protein
MNENPIESPAASADHTSAAAGRHNSISPSRRIVSYITCTPTEKRSSTRFNSAGVEIATAGEAKSSFLVSYSRPALNAAPVEWRNVISRFSITLWSTGAPPLALHPEARSGDSTTAHFSSNRVSPRASIISKFYIELIFIYRIRSGSIMTPKITNSRTTAPMM